MIKLFRLILFEINKKNYRQNYKYYKGKKYPNLIFIWEPLAIVAIAIIAFFVVKFLLTLLLIIILWNIKK